MGLFDFLFGKSHISKVHDDFFGELKYHKIHNSPDGFFSGKKLLEPLGEQIELLIFTTAENHPTEKQKQFFEKIEQDFKNLKEQWRIELQDTIQNADEYVEIDVLEKHFKLCSITIPKQLNDVEWEVSFDSISEIDEDHIFTVIMKDWKTNGVNIDG